MSDNVIPTGEQVNEGLFTSRPTGPDPSAHTAEEFALHAAGAKLLMTRISGFWQFSTDRDSKLEFPIFRASRGGRPMEINVSLSDVYGRLMVEGEHPIDRLIGFARDLRDAANAFAEMVERDRIEHPLMYFIPGLIDPIPEAPHQVEEGEEEPEEEAEGETTTRPHKRIVANEFALNDAGGVTRAKLYMREMSDRSVPSLELFDAAGNPRLTLATTDSGASFLEMVDSNGQTRLLAHVSGDSELSSGGDGRPSLVLYSATGKRLVEIESSGQDTGDDGQDFSHGQISIFDSLGNKIEVLGNRGGVEDFFWTVAILKSPDGFSPEHWNETPGNAVVESILDQQEAMGTAIAQVKAYNQLALRSGNFSTWAVAMPPGTRLAIGSYHDRKDVTILASV